MLRLLHKTAIVTGSSSGIGRAISLAYASQGARIICADLSPKARAEKPEEVETPTHELVKQKGGEAVYVKCDVGNTEDVQGAVEEARRWGGRVDVMVNNAGISIESSHPAEIQDTSDETYDTTMRVNAKSVFLGCKYAAKQMIAQEPWAQTGDRGWIINLSSIAGLIGLETSPSYAASKGAVISLTKQIAIDLAKYRIHCNAICPGFVDTAIFKHTIQTWHRDAVKGAKAVLDARHPFRGVGRVENIANAAVFLASQDASWVTGVALPVDGGYVAL